MMVVEKKKTHWCLMIRIGLVVIFTPVKSIYYICLWFISLLTFLQSCRYTLKKDVFRTTLTCCLFHLYLGCISYMETTHYNFDYEQHRIEKLLKYCFYLIFIFHTSTYITDNKRHVNCVLTFITSLVLTPFALYETWVQCRTPSLQHMDALQEDMLLFYIAFCIMDMVIGYWYYPEYFKWLEGVLHHIVTMLFASYFLWAHKEINFCISLIEEFSSIFLILYHLFPHVTLFKKIFHQFFVLFRIVIPTVALVLIIPILSCRFLLRLSSILGYERPVFGDITLGSREFNFHCH